MIDRFISWLYIWKIWGSRCSEFEPTCIICKEWARHDWVFKGPWAGHYVSLTDGDILEAPQQHRM